MGQQQSDHTYIHRPTYPYTHTPNMHAIYRTNRNWQCLCRGGVYYNVICQKMLQVQNKIVKLYYDRQYKNNH